MIFTLTRGEVWVISGVLELGRGFPARPSPFFP